MAKKEKIAEKKLKKEEKKLTKEAKKLKKEEEHRMLERNLARYLSRLTVKQLEMLTKFSNECLDKDGKTKKYINELMDEKEKALVREFIDVGKGKIKVPAIGARDLADLWKRQHFSFIDRKPEKQAKRYEPVTPGYSDSKPDNPKPDNQTSQEPNYDEPSRQPVQIDEKLFDELDKHSDQINKYLDGV